MRCKRRNIKCNDVGKSRRVADPVNLAWDGSSVIHLFSGRVASARRRGCRALILGRNLRKPSKRVYTERPDSGLGRYTRSASNIVAFLSLIFLLLLMVGMINPSSSEKTYALESNNDGNASQLAYSGNIMDLRRSLLNPDLLNRELTLDNLGSDSTEFMELSSSDLNLLSDTATTYADNSLSMSIGGSGLEDAVTLLPGQVAYRAHTVTVSSTNMKNYTLTINGPVGLSANSSTGTTITGADNKTPTNMVDNSWGYAYGQGPNTTLSNSDLASMTYSSFTGSNQDIDKANASPNFTKNLVFAAKFSKDAEAGHYKATVNLSITATPKVITTYTLSYDANSGTGAPSAQTYTDTNEEGSHTFTISSTTPTRSNYEFQSWNTNSGGTGITYNPNGSITLQSSTPTQTLYAKWAQIYTRTLSFNANGGSGAPSSKSCSSTNTSCSVTIPSTKPTRTNYTFQSWNTKSDGSGTSYSAESNITISGDTPLYAVWKDVRTLADITNMQDMTPEVCANTNVGTTKQLFDSRTSNATYNVGKTADGRCWMFSILQLLGTKTISSVDSDMTSGSFTIPGSNSSGFNSSDKDSPKLYVQNGSIYYYNWYTATAGTAPSYGNATSSICPKGWTLPTGGASGNTDFYNLFRNMGLTVSDSLSASGYTLLGSSDLSIVQHSPYSFTFTGYVSDGSVQGADSVGSLWSSTAYSSISTYAAGVDKGNSLQGSHIYPGTQESVRRYYGLPIRCIARN